MPSDRARRSYDAGRMYRSVVSQQGRVTLEADANEAEEIRAAQSRAEVIDIVGPTGTPDDGFKISVPDTATPFDFAIGQGTLYVGGVRLVSAANLTYLRQKDAEWADYPHPDWVHYAASASWPYPAAAPLTEFIYVAVTEQEVSAVEDPVLREVALGGPDTAGRTRLIQRVHRTPMFGADCEEAIDEVLRRKWPGLTQDHETMQLASAARLKVDFVPVAGPIDPCQPTGQPGFLGAENQLMRVQAVDANTLLWGYDNASSLYRAEIDTTDAKLLVLKGAPVDAFHHPQVNQWVEVLRTEVTLGGDAYVANAVGAPAQVASYDAGTNVITLTAALTGLPAGAQVPPLFVRVWEGRTAFSGNGTATELFNAKNNSTGVLIFTNGIAAAGDYWMIGVRPSTPDEILPARLLQFQPPDGPARWAAPLGTIEWHADLTAEIHDCRRPFDNLVELTSQKCCEVKILPGDDAQRIIDKRLVWMKARGITSLHVRFAAGVFELDAPLVITGPVGGELSISGCGTMLSAVTQEVALLITDWQSASVVDLSVSATIAKPGQGKKGRRDVIPPAAGDEFRHLGGAITFLNCAASNLERVDAACGTGDSRAASCVTIRNADERPGDARVRACRFAAGSRQVGMLLVNVNRATVDDNRIGWNAPASARIPSDALKRALISDVSFNELFGHEVAGWQVAAFYDVPQACQLHYRTHFDLTAAWQAAFDELAELPSPGDDGEVSSDAWRKLQRVVSSILTQIIHRHRSGLLHPSDLTMFHKWIDQMLKLEETVAAAGQAIVVGGVHAQDVRILHNTIADAMDGIHVGQSTRGDRDTHLFADRLQVVGNTISLRIPWYDRRAHAGIFVGNATMATVRDNQVHIQLIPSPWADAAEKYYEKYKNDKDAEIETNYDDTNYRNDTIENEFATRFAFATREADAIRVWGMPGRMLLVTGNVSENAHVGIRVVQERPPDGDGLFLLTQNLAVNADRPIHVTGNVNIADDNIP